MRFFIGGLNHAKTAGVHEMRAITTAGCPACLAYLAQKRAGLRPPTLPEPGAPRRHRGTPPAS